ncbi:Dam family site-specific DNA-(adenine-N6)-methyltransferase [Luteimonas sp. BDR2-5]|uniref:DNA adenine methylase n=1 Tax=Proluteimonas luteida TaxID=2878685 RepID=UPI001E2FFDD1|nr:Dam family site-specific DNA-(adenine-N6)-methyltransferase [Luteimonas sp. BDR2-5]MCD9029093.1 Dam family site-specific DNA-(adenine-N6)-methyltransferase [Luteimonas sp. BDR2-5]
MRPLVRWAGSKKKLLPKLSEYWLPTYERYIEAFAGSASLFFHLEPSCALLNDSNNELIEAYNVLKQDPHGLHEKLISIENSEETYYEWRSADTARMSQFDAAVRFFYLNRFCFNGIYRTNRSGQFNVPYGGQKSGAVPTLDEWMQASERLKSAELSSEDFESFVLRNARQGDFVYLDPPYAVSNRRIFRQYSAQTFGVEDVQRLSDVLYEIDQRGAKFVVSYAKSPETKEIALGWKVRQTVAQRNVAGFSEHRRQAVEVFITNI